MQSEKIVNVDIHDRRKNETKNKTRRRMGQKADSI